MMHKLLSQSEGIYLFWQCRQLEAAIQEFLENVDFANSLNFGSFSPQKTKPTFLSNENKVSCYICVCQYASNKERGLKRGL